MPWKLNGQIISGAFTIGNTQYPPNWLDLAPQTEKDALGITWEEPPPAPVYIPTLSPWQTRKVLRRHNLLATVEAIVATLDADGQDGWEYATYVERTNPLVEYVCTQASMTSEQIDAMFIEGSEL